MTPAATNPVAPTAPRRGRRAAPAAARAGLAAAFVLGAALLTIPATSPAAWAQSPPPDAKPPELAPAPPSADQAAPTDDDGPLPPLPPQARGVDVEEHVGQFLPMDVTFTNAEGKTIALGDYFKDGKPAIIAMVYYKCPIVCSVMMSRLTETINQLDYNVGTDYRALIFSVDPTETTRDAAAVKRAHVSGYNREVTPEVDAGWEFHTTDDSASRRLADALGFRYRKLASGVYSHPVAMFVVTPDGRISRYLYGFSRPTRDMKLALLEASEGKLVRTIGDRLMLRCYMYDPKAGSYTLQATRVMQIGGVITVAALSTLVGCLFVGERFRRSRALRAAAECSSAPATPSDPTSSVTVASWPSAGGGTP